MIGWYYRARKRKFRNTLDKIEEIWDVVEYFPADRFVAKDQKGKGGWTRDAIAPAGASKKELIQCLKWMLKDVQKRKVLYDKDWSKIRVEYGIQNQK